ncbi:hypothetical protein GHK39_31505 [Sinorhizobium medicae]|uniref:hypothetical protein n=1 Tax=Sinorhizobium medicae TaxID=110321 RepID=UPI001294C3A1|nr:hypothetical protein [Sinorhizobium medicae]MQV88995.1 hypothetical protein [Sinorhizobium medicae]MQV95682.1 hypothetical protein [Sinorhizobium medicae]
MKQMPGVDFRAAAEAVRCARSTMFLGMEIASRFTDVLIAKGVLTRGEARATLYAIAESIRDDAGGTGSEETTEAIARYLEEVGDSFKA